MTIAAIDLRDECLSLLQGQLGTYTFEDGSVVDAIAIIPDPDLGYDYPRAGTHPSGVELIIQIPYPDAKPLLGLGINKPRTWQIYLKQWDNTKNLIDATNTLINGLPYLLTKIVPVPPNENLGTIEQVRIELMDYEFASVSGT